MPISGFEPDLIYYNNIYILIPTQTFFYLGVLFILIIPGQVPLPEPYFDLTPIRATHTKITC